MWSVATNVKIKGICNLCADIKLIFKTPAGLKILACLLFVLFVVSKQLQVGKLDL